MKGLACFTTRRWAINQFDNAPVLRPIPDQPDLREIPVVNLVTILMKVEILLAN
jgi:hypothetical protein